jgi:hypothetical protein
VITAGADRHGDRDDAYATHTYAPAKAAVQSIALNRSVFKKN